MTFIIFLNFNVFFWLSEFFLTKFFLFLPISERGKRVKIVYFFVYFLIKKKAKKYGIFLR